MERFQFPLAQRSLPRAGILTTINLIELATDIDRYRFVAGM
jgi:hypothetical protein